MRATLSIAFLLALAPTAAAQTIPVAVVPVAVGSGDPAEEAARAERVASMLPSGRFVPLAIDEARRRFSDTVSSDPPTVTDTDIERWLALSREAVRHLAHADYDAARQALLEAQTLSEGAAAELNREATRARQVLDTCLYDVRRFIETRDPRAEPRTLECRRLVPRVQPSRFNHTPEVLSLLDRVDRRLAEAPPGALRIDSVPTGCTVRLNGIEFGTTPFVSEELGTGEYTAQVECEAGRRGRVHRIRVREGTTAVTIDARFDAAVRTDTALRLHYRDLAAAAERAADGGRLAEAIGAAEAWLVLDGEQGTLRIERVRAGGRGATAVVIATEATLPRALAALAAGRSEDWTSGATRPIRGPVARDDEPRAEADEDRTASLVAGSALGVLAVGGYVTAFALYGWRQDAGARLAVAYPSDPDYLDRFQTWLDRRPPIWVASWVSAATGTAAVALLMHDEEGVPWWSWLLAGVGAAAAAVGIAEIALASPCPPTVRQTQACVEAAAPVDRGVVVSSLGVPLLAVPVVYALRSALGPGATAAASASGEGARLEIGGTF